ncbi:MAG: Gfo/Idh/MocA family oxidoreductase [Thermoguttaceae bacterium]|jgi:hypothetical protein
MAKHRWQITRRSFLQSVGAAGVGAMALPEIVPSTVFGADAPSNKLNVALLACGERAVSDLPRDQNVVAICDVDTRPLGQLKKDLDKAGQKTKVYEDYRKLLDNEKSVEAVVIAPGQRWHVPMSKRAMLAGKHVFCEKPLAHSAAQAREIRELAKHSPKLVTQVGSQGGATDTFRRSMEVIQAGVLGQIREVFVWMDRGCGRSTNFDTHADPIPKELNWDFWCGPSKVLPFKNGYLGFCLNWGPWLEFGDGHLADMGAHGLNLPWRALQLGAPTKASVEIPEPLKDSYPSATKFRWEFAARENLPPVTLWWNDGGKSGVPQELVREVLTTYGSFPGNGVLFAGEKGILWSDCWGVGGVVKLKNEAKGHGVLTHEGCKSVPVTLPRVGGDHMGEFLRACKGGPRTFQGFETAASVAEIAMVGIVTLRYGKPIEWDSEALAVKGEPAAEPFVHRPVRTKWL